MTSTTTRLLVYKDEKWARQGAPWIVMIRDGYPLPRFDDGTDFRDDHWVGHFQSLDEAWSVIPGFFARCDDPATEWYY